MIFIPQLISKEGFLPFGEVITTAGSPVIINNGYARRFNRVMTLDHGNEKGKTQVSIFTAQKRKFPMRVDMMEKHPLGSQAFIPMKETTFLALVSPTGEKPDLTQTQAFLIPPGLGINLHAGVWHFPLISTEDMNFLVIDREGPGDNLVIEDFQDREILVEFPNSN